MNGQISSIPEGKWEGEIAKLPTGGPYRLEFRAVDASAKTISEITVNNVLVGDLWILAGQSNMHGRGELSGAESPDELIHNFDLADRWSIAEEPVGSSLEAVDPAHWAARDSQGRLRPYTLEEVAEYTLDMKRGATPGMFFAKEMVRRTGVPIGLIPCARGATSLEKWSPVLQSDGPASLYGSMLRRFVAVGGRVAGLLWYQGESDALEKISSTYQERFTNFICSVRADFRQPDLRFYFVQLGRHTASYLANWNEVQLAQLEVEKALPNMGMIAAVDLEVMDAAHIAVNGLRRIGWRLANLACADLFADLKPWGQWKRGPRPVSAELIGEGRDRIVVRFSSVNGRLRADGRMSGFSLRKADGSEWFDLYRAIVDPESPDSVLLYIKPKSLTPNVQLWYGWGNNPYCNLRDEQDMAVPVFGPLEIKQ